MFANAPPWSKPSVPTPGPDSRRCRTRSLRPWGEAKRHLFIPERSCFVAYADRPIPIGPRPDHIAAVHRGFDDPLAEVAPDDVVLEVGTGSGYQAAVLAHLSRKVCTIEIIPSLAETAAKTLRDLAYENVSVRLGDGYGGWPDCGPFDAIVVTAALGELPPPLIEQLKEGGRLVMPVGSAYGAQQLTVVEKIAPGKTTTRAVAQRALCALYAFAKIKAGSGPVPWSGRASPKLF